MTLNTIVTAIVFTATMTRASVPPSSSMASSANTTDASPTRAEPTDERHRRPPLSSADERERHRHHPNHGEADDGVDDDAGIEILERGKHETGAEDEPQRERQQVAAQLGELDRLDRVSPGRPPEDEPADEGGHERVPTSL